VEIEARDASSRVGNEGMICYLEVIADLPPSRTNREVQRSGRQATVRMVENVTEQREAAGFVTNLRNQFGCGCLTYDECDVEQCCSGLAAN